MDDIEKVDPKDAKAIKWLILPGFFAFVFLGLISEGVWVHWIMIFGGWYLSALIGWHMYKYYVIERKPSSKKLFYSNYVLAQIGIIVLVYIFIKVEYAI